VVALFIAISTTKTQRTRRITEKVVIGFGCRVRRQI
jgi:hypothetical protein